MGLQRPTKLIQRRRRLEYNPTYVEDEHGNIVPQYGFGSWLKRNTGNVLQTAAGAALVATGAGASVGAGMMAGGVTGMIGDRQSRSMEKEQEKDVERMRQFSNLQSGFQDETIPYAPSFAYGGVMDYNVGQTHEGPDGGIPVDSSGVPSAVSQREPVALTEEGEISWKTPDGEVYIFSDRLKAPKSKKSFAEEAKKITNKYKGYLGDKFEKHHKVSMDTMNRELNDLMAKQEELRQELMPPVEQEMPMMGRGGTLLDPLTPLSLNTLDRPKIDLASMKSSSINVPRANTPNPNPNAQLPEWEQFQGGVPLSSLALPVLSNIGAGMAERQRIRRRSPIRLPRVTPQTVNLESSRVAARETAGEQRAAGRRAYRGAGVSRGAAIAGTSVMEGDINRQLGQQLSESYLQEGLTNAQLAGQAETANVDLAMRESIMNREQSHVDEAVLRGYRDSALGAVNQYLADDQMSREHADYLNIMQPNFVLEQEPLSRTQRLYRQPKRRVRVRDPRNQD